MRPSTRGLTRRRREDGVASVELVAILPFVLLFAVITLQVAATLWTVRAADEAARTAARVYSIDGSFGNVRAAADESLPGGITLLSVVPYGGAHGVQVRVQVPGPTPLGPPFVVTREVVMP